MSDDEIRAMVREELEREDERYTTPLVLRDDGKAVCGLRMSHRDGDAYLRWSTWIMYGDAVACVEMN